jgi:prophage antirepressor-like protein
MIQIFNNSEFGDIRTIMEGGKVLFCSSDVANALGYSNSRDAVSRHCRGVVKRDALTEGGIQLINFISEGDVYRLITHSRLPGAERFEKWVFDEVLPTIRRHGVYAMDELLANPDVMIAALQELKTEREKCRTLELENAQNRQLIGELTPKASYHDLILQCKATVPVTQIAKDYGMSGKAFNSLLHKLGIQYRLWDTWLLYQKFADKGYTQSRTYYISPDHSTTHTYWTQKGRLFLYDLLKSKHGILPMIEKEAA